MYDTVELNMERNLIQSLETHADTSICIYIEVFRSLLMFVPLFVISDGNETLSISDAPGTQE